MKEQKNELMWSHIYWLGMLGTTGSYTAAARRLGVSKGAVSLRIAELEQVSGVALVQRTTRSVRLTEAGEALVNSTRKAFTDIEQGFDSIRDLASTPRGVVRVTMPVALGRQKIMPLINDFLHSHPDVRMEIELSDHVSSLAREGFDLAIRHTSHVPDTHVAWLLQASSTLLVAAPTYLQAHGSPRRPQDLTGHNCLYYLRSAASPAWSFAPVRRESERHSVEVQGNFCANNSEALRELVLAGQGIAMLPDFTAQTEVDAGHLVHLLPGWKPVGVFGDAIYAIRPYSAYVPRAVRAFVDYLKEAFAPASQARVQSLAR
ncbi:LysR family transcriptional regulator [Pollutimonas harenae]|uniref:LysR family transcriptional regulator n=1 Tax=Pollutimonas harenae TaxID=657015 RepID=A0A853H0Y3_9BURK|nr:LysR family transcriptional regulator [Pollutimonas harenae]NYT85982.1 LysR family transcriptional regulator [Pollutimonas harenae]TEA71031.1 LysR family transcriptional regulator [Pollutimonas harenae]